MILADTHLKCYKLFVAESQSLLDTLVKIEQADIVNEEKLLSLYEATFLKIFIAFEGYMESTFMCYLMGKKSKDGYKPKIRIKFTSVDDAYNWVHGQILANGDFIDWSNINYMNEKAKLLWGEDINPYGVMHGTMPDYKHIKTLRNAVAHLSRFHFNTLKDVERHFLTTTEGRQAGKILTAEHSTTKRKLIFEIRDTLVGYAELNQIKPN